MLMLNEMNLKSFQNYKSRNRVASQVIQANIKYPRAITTIKTFKLIYSVILIAYM